MPRRSRSRNISFARSGVIPTSASEVSVSRKSWVMSDPYNSRTVTAKGASPRLKNQNPRTKNQIAKPSRPWNLGLGIWFLPSIQLKFPRLPRQELELEGSPVNGILCLTEKSQFRQTDSQGKAVMCGIVGYVGHREAEPILVEG